MTTHRIVTRHFVKRTALRELARLWRLQAEAVKGNGEAELELDNLGITSQSSLSVRHEPNRFAKWAVASP